MRNASDLSVGIDFGTTNTVVAIAGPDGRAEAIRFVHAGEPTGVYVSALCFWEERRGRVAETRVEGGPWAIEQFLDGTDPHRFLQSFKTFAASRAFQETRIFRQRFTFESLLVAFLRTLLRHAGARLDTSARSIVIGRPVRFAGANPDDALAMRRYRAAFERAGIAGGRYVYEPVGAAFYFAERLDGEAIVLVADFGGGTSDFTVMRFRRSAGRLSAEPLGSSGIGIAGDAFDYRIIDHVVSPRLGKGGSYRSSGKILPMPNGHYANFARWNQLAMMKANGELRALAELEKLALAPQPIRQFVEIIENDLGFALYRAVSAAKVALSSQDSTDFRFHHGGIDIAAAITREAFESWIADDVRQIADTVDEALRRAGVRPDAVDHVFLTGGSSFVPAIRRLFVERFGTDRLTSADQFESIAYGLALIGRSESADQWMVDEGAGPLASG
jgi:hypothetical chaperone protein